jgi:hypothetical protein
MKGGNSSSRWVLHRLGKSNHMWVNEQPRAARPVSRDFPLKFSDPVKSNVSKFSAPEYGSVFRGSLLFLEASKQRSISLPTVEALRTSVSAHNPSVQSSSQSDLLEDIQSHSLLQNPPCSFPFSQKHAIGLCQCLTILPISLVTFLEDTF